MGDTVRGEFVIEGAHVERRGCSGSVATSVCRAIEPAQRTSLSFRGLDKASMGQLPAHASGLMEARFSGMADAEVSRQLSACWSSPAFTLAPVVRRTPPARVPV